MATFIPDEQRLSMIDDNTAPRTTTNHPTPETRLPANDGMGTKRTPAKPKASPAAAAVAKAIADAPDLAAIAAKQIEDAQKAVQDIELSQSH
ncbi:hypothetical protein GB937_004191 [Aspergillus fischeri]|nr:hypothetical protein GB937_004191 [Aspergillus fischeri]